MKSYLDAYIERMERNHLKLIQLAKDVIKINPKIEVFCDRDYVKKFIKGIHFLDGETVNTIYFHEVPYRWSGCGYKEHYGSNNTSEMPFDAKDVLDSFVPITSIRKSQKEIFKTKEQYLKWCSYLVNINHILS